MIRIKVVITFFSTLLLSLNAAVSSKLFQEQAAERLTVEIIASSILNCEHSEKVQKISLIAKVIKVIKTKSKLSKGDIILISYSKDLRSHIDPGIVVNGPQQLLPPEPLKESVKCTVYLNKLSSNNFSGNVYEPGAHQYSFEKIK